MRNWHHCTKNRIVLGKFSQQPLKQYENIILLCKLHKIVNVLQQKDVVAHSQMQVRISKQCYISLQVQPTLHINKLEKKFKTTNI
jgi:hypothetical protein